MSSPRTEKVRCWAFSKIITDIYFSKIKPNSNNNIRISMKETLRRRNIRKIQAQTSFLPLLPDFPTEHMISLQGVAVMVVINP